MYLKQGGGTLQELFQLIHELTWAPGWGIQAFHAGLPVSERRLKVLFCFHAAGIVGVYKMDSGHQAVSNSVPMFSWIWEGQQEQELFSREIELSLFLFNNIQTRNY